MEEGERLRRELVAMLARRGIVKSRSVAEALSSVPRERFLPELAAREGLAAVYVDRPVAVKTDPAGRPISSSSQPGIMAEMLERLALEPGQRVLEIGAGSGYNAALLAHIVGRRGSVTSVELEPDLAATAAERLGGRARVVCGDGRLGAADGAPYDRMLVTASALDVPRAWHEQLRPRGLLELPLMLADSEALPQAIPTLRRVEQGFDSIANTSGGFMRLRPSTDEPAIAAPLLEAALCDAAGRTPLVELAGGALGRLGPRQRARLLALLLGAPRRRPLGLRAPAWELSQQLALAIGPQRLVASGVRLGLLGPGGNGLALLSVSPRFLTTRLDCYGDPAAERALAGQVAAWRRRGSPRARDLRIRVRYDRRARAWRRLRRPEALLLFDVGREGRLSAR